MPMDGPENSDIYLELWILRDGSEESTELGVKGVAQPNVRYGNGITQDTKPG
jgi:hypothetical protein